MPLQLSCRSPLGTGRASKGPGATSSLGWASPVLQPVSRAEVLQPLGPLSGFLDYFHQDHICFMLRSQRCTQLCRWGLTVQRGRGPSCDLLPALLRSISAQSWFWGSQCMCQIRSSVSSTMVYSCLSCFQLQVGLDHGRQTLLIIWNSLEQTVLGMTNLALGFRLWWKTF